MIRASGPLRCCTFEIIVYETPFHVYSAPGCMHLTVRRWVIVPKLLRLENTAGISVYVVEGASQSLRPDGAIGALTVPSKGSWYIFV